MDHTEVLENAPTPTIHTGRPHAKALGRTHGRRYVFITLSALLLLWAPVIGFLLHMKPTYTCKWTLILPGTGLGASVHLDNLGETATAVSSPYSNSSIDPKTKYKAIALSQPVLAAAARTIPLSPEAFGEPQIKLVEQTTLMQFAIKGASAEQAYHKAVAHMNALEARLEQLRLDEIQRRGDSSAVLLRDAREKLENIQASLLAYQTDSKLTSLDQLKELTLTLEQLRREQTMQQARYRYVEKRQAQLTTNLNIAPRLAADALTLQAAPVFQQYLRAYAEAQAKLAEDTGKWGARHPDVLKVQQHAHQAYQAMVQNATLVLGRPLQDPQGISQLLLGTNLEKRSQLLQDLITADADRQGIVAQLQSLQQSVQEVEKRLQLTNKLAAGLSDLVHKQQVATTIFTSLLARQDIGKSDLFASYPLIQTLAAPMLPHKPDTLKSMLALFGGISGSCCILIGVTLLWYRQTSRQKMLKSA
jgi:uncharacterized protein involved in exopolysaccharide biosynthesis